MNVGIVLITNYLRLILLYYTIYGARVSILLISDKSKSYDIICYDSVFVTNGSVHAINIPVTNN